MEVLWQKGHATVSDVVASLPADPPLAYSTVLTTCVFSRPRATCGTRRRGVPSSMNP